MLGGAQPQQMPTDFEQQQAEETGSPARRSHRDIAHHHIVQAHRSLGWNQDTSVQKRDLAGGVATDFMKLAQKPDLTRRDISDMIAGRMASGAMSPDEAIQTLKTLPADDKDEAALHDWVQRHLTAVLIAGSHLHAAYPESAFPRGGSQPGQGAAPGQSADEEAPSQ